MEAEAALKDAQAGATVINATLQTTQTTASVYDASIAEIEIRLAKLEKDRQRYEKFGQTKCGDTYPVGTDYNTEYEATFRSWKQPGASGRRLFREWYEVSHRRENTEAAIQRATAAL